jgi:energy-coupling factor transporter ATP-binding protein EcfA2
VTLPPDAQIPDELVAACAAGDCVLFAGSGISAQAGYPTWRDALAQMLDAGEADGSLRDAATLRTALNNGSIALVAELLSDRVGPERLSRMVHSVYRERPRPLPRLARALGQIPFDSVITGSWDRTIEETFASRIADPARQVLTPWTTEKLPEILRERRFVVLKIFGDPDHEKGVLFTPDQYRREIYDNPELARYLGTLFSTRTILYAGVSLQGINDFLSALFQVVESPRRHFALVPRQPDIEVQAQLYGGRWNVELLTYEASPEHPEVPALFERLEERVASIRPEPIKRGAGADVTPFGDTPYHLDWVELKNVGPFQQLRLDFKQPWTVILGNNACGKSTVLRAIALALCGDDSRATALAAPLLRVGATSGQVTLSVNGVLYSTDLVRDRDQVRARPRQVTPLQSGQWLVLGFPALRGATSRDPSGPSTVGLPDPAVSDLTPLLTGGVDARLDNLKQWIVNTAVAAESFANGSKRQPAQKSARQSRASGGVAQDDGAAYQALLDRIFGILAELTAGVDLRFSRVDRETWRVIVTAGGVEVPVDQLSQGTSAILGWVGTVLQRVTEVYGRFVLPAQPSVLVLIDEIDAHMHPEWQQQLVPLLKRHLPGVQIIATTHSPLIVGSLQADELVRLRRRDGVIEADSLETSFQGWRADQILTGPAFDLDTTIDDDTDSLRQEYTSLLGKTNRSPREQARFGALERQIEQRVPGHLETPAEREAYDLLQEWLLERIASQPDDRKEIILREARKLLAELDGEAGGAAR